MSVIADVRPLSARSASAASSAEPTSVTSQPCAKSSISRLVYSRFTVPLVPSTDTRFGLRAGAGRLDRGHGADEGHLVSAAQMRHDQRGSGIAGDHHEIGGVGRDQLADQRHHAGDDLLLAVVAIGEEGVVGDIDVMRVGTGADDLAQDREAAKAGIEHENRRRS